MSIYIIAAKMKTLEMSEVSFFFFVNLSKMRVKEPGNYQSFG